MTQFLFATSPHAHLRRIVATFLLAFGLMCAAASSADAARIKDIVAFEGVRDNMLIGYGIVVGLNGTGDALRNAPMTKQSLEAMLERLGVNTRDANLNTKNVAAVMVMAITFGPILFAYYLTRDTADVAGSGK